MPKTFTSLVKLSKVARQPQFPLLRLPAELVLEILLHLYHDDWAGFLALRQVSKLLRQRCEGVMFQRLKFRGRSFEPGLRARLLDVNDGLAAQVRIVESAFSMQIGMLEAMARLTSLRVLIWSVPEEMPKCLLDFIHARPQIQLYIIGRVSRAGNLDSDSVALSSPLLHSLDTTVYCSDGSDFSTFRDQFLKAKGLKNLTLRLDRDHTTQYYPPGEGELRLEPDVMFPALQSLTLEGGSWHWYDQQDQKCRIWAPHIDWSKLRRLHIALATSASTATNHSLLSALTGHVRGLKSLALGFRHDHDRNFSSHFGATPWASPREIDQLRRFLGSIDALQELELYVGESVSCRGLEPSIFQGHGSSLRKLVIHLGMRQGWDASHFQDLRMYAPGLEELAVPVAMYREEVERSESGLHHRLTRSLHRERNPQQLPRSGWPARVESVLKSFPRLRHLKLRVHLRADSTHFIRVSRHGARYRLIKKMAEETLTRLFEQLRGLTSLMLVFRGVESYNERIFKIERRWIPKHGRYCAVLEDSYHAGDFSEKRRMTPGRSYDPWSWIEQQTRG